MGGDIGVALTACITLTGSLQYGIRQSAEAENLMTSVERVMDYAELESEANLTSSKETTAFRDGVISFQNVWLKYSENSKPVLKDISFKSTKHEKIIVQGISWLKNLINFQGILFIYKNIWSSVLI